MFRSARSRAYSRWRRSPRSSRRARRSSGSTTTRRRARTSPSRRSTSSKRFQPSQRSTSVRTCFLRMFAGCAVAVFVAAASAQEDFSKVEIQTEKLADTVYMMTGEGGNLGVSVGDDAVFVIDYQFPPLPPKIQPAIAKLTSKPVKFVLNTHWHFDHTGGNENLGNAGAIIVAHENVRKRLSTEGFIEFLGMKTKPEPKVALPVATFTRDITFRLNG